MFSGKTSHLVEILDLFYTFNTPYSIYKHPNDLKRHPGHAYIITHDQIHKKFGECNIHEELSLTSFKLDENAVAFIDEVQFYSLASIGVIKSIRMGFKLTVCAFLNQDYQGRAWDAAKELLPLSDMIIHCHAKCKCGGVATRSKRLRGEDGMLNLEQVEVGGGDKYEAVCVKCWEG